MKKYLTMFIALAIFQGVIYCADLSIKVNDKTKLNNEIRHSLLSAREFLKNVHTPLELDSILDALLIDIEKRPLNKLLAIQKIKAIKDALEAYKLKQYPTVWSRLFGPSPQIVSDCIEPAIAKVNSVLTIVNSNNYTTIAGVFSAGAAALAGVSLYTVFKKPTSTESSVAKSSLSTTSSGSFFSTGSDKVTRYPYIQLSELPLVQVPTDGQILSLDSYNILYPILSTSKPKKIEYRSTMAGVSVIELPVLQQNCGQWQGDSVDMGDFDGYDAGKKIYTMSELQSADGLNCGYHALKNVIYMLAACKKLEEKSDDDAKELLYRMQDIPSFTQLLTPWLQQVIPYRYLSDKNAYRRYPRGNFPSGTELEKLIGDNRSKPLISEDLEDVFDDGLHSHILIVDSFFYFNNVSFSTEKYLDFLQKGIISKDGIYGFVVNSAADQDLSTARGSHWFGYVLWKKDGKIIWLYTDSLFGRRDHVTIELIRICSQTPQEMTTFFAAKNYQTIDEPLIRVEARASRFSNGTATAQDSPNDVFDQLLREPIVTAKWNEAIVDRIFLVLFDTIAYIVLHKSQFASQYAKFKKDKDKIFVKIKKDIGDDYVSNNSLYDDMLEQLRS